MASGNKKTLWIGRLPEQCNPMIDVPFGIISLVGRENQMKVFLANGLCLDIDNSPNELINAEQVVTQLFRNEFLTQVVKKIQIPDSLNYRSEFWSIVLSPWLMFLLQTCYLNYLLLRKYIELYGNQEIDVIIASHDLFERPPATTAELVEILLHQSFHTWVVARYLQASKPDRWKIKLCAPEKLVLPATNGISLLKAIKQRIWKHLAELRCTSEQIPLVWRIQCGLLLKLRRVSYYKKNELDLSPIPLERTACVPSFFIETTRSIINECIPAWYRDDFTEHYKRIANRGYRAGYGRIVSSDIYDDESNLIKAMAVEKGEVVFSVQHGGGYGTHKVFCLSPQSEYLGGPFITWGWQSHEAYHVETLPLASPTLSRLRVARRRAKLGNDIMFVGGDMSPFKLRMHSKPAGTQWLDYREQKVAFLKELADEVFATILYRGYYTGTLLDEDFLLERFPSIRLCSGNYYNFHRHLLSARLCVVDHPITTLHQVLAMNIPTVAYWNHDHWGLSAQATPLFAELERTGIVHRSGELAGRFINKNFERIETWWATEEVQTARQRWCDVYARTSEHWVRDWVKAIWGKKTEGQTYARQVM